MGQSRLSLIIIFVLLFILLRFNRRSSAIPLRYYPVLFAVPIVLCMFQNMPSIFLNYNLFRYRNDFFVITVLVTAVFIAIYTPVILTRLRRILRDLKKSRSTLRCSIKSFLCFLSDSFLNIISVSTIMLLIYIQLSISLFSVEKGADNISAGSNSDLAVCAAIIAACATLYNVQRTLKQESTKNRQAWITSVRFETANLIAAVDKIKLYERHHNQNGYRDGGKREKLLDSMIESCTKLRMLINPNDAVAPMLTAQLDAIANYYNENFNDEANYINHIENVNLRKSFMPWVLVLLKVEWERVKAILESREEIREGYYSKGVYEEQWNVFKLREYGVNVENEGDIIVLTSLYTLFSGFNFNNEVKESIVNNLKIFHIQIMNEN